ncbi:MAG: 50S ribosomal protein L29 [Chloroflexi bacterium RBG_13_52_14]|jgi:large subunit ribosomal protein L29|nr:MAG: 50S ribosomal protein L29 [Chloroflexi bacterium RBG_13_52_14]
MRVDKIKALSANELSKQLDDTYQELFNLRFRHATRQLSNYSELRKVKKRIAVMKTIMRERELAGE